MLDVIAFDADDTLWHTEHLYSDAQEKFSHLLAAYNVPAGIEQKLFEIETRNLRFFGFGIKSFALSMIETAIELTDGQTTGGDIQRVIDLAKEMLSAETYGVPPQALQRGSAQTLDSGDDRMQQVELIGGELWGALDTVVNPAHEATPRAGVAWFRVRPALAGQSIGSARMIGQGYLASKGNYLLYPALQVSPEGAIAMVFTLSGPSIFPSAAYSVMADDRAFGKIRVAGAGTGPYMYGNTSRWGDYSYAAIDPNGRTLWFATEYIPPAASQTHDGRNNWGTRVFEVDINYN
jgi:hypothetical protein